MDDNLVIDDVCAAFGQHVKYLVMESEPIVQVLSRCLAMESQRAIDLKPLPSRVQEKTKVPAYNMLKIQTL